MSDSPKEFDKTSIPLTLPYRKTEFEPAWADLLTTLRVAVRRDLAGRLTN